MGFAVIAAAILLAVTPHVPVFQLGPSPRWADSAGPRYLDLAEDGRSVRVVGPGDREWTLDPATKKAIPEPLAAREFDLIERKSGLFDLVDAKGKRVQTLFDPDFKLKDGTWALSADRRYLVTSFKNNSSVWRVADGRRVLAQVSLKPGDFWAIRGDELLIPGWVNLSEDKHVTRYSGCFERRDLKTGQELPKLLLQTECDPGGWRTTPDGRHAVTLFGDRLLRVDLEAKVVLPTLTLSALGADTTLYSRGRLAFAPSGKGLAFGWGGDVVGLDYPSGRVRWRTPLPLTGSPRADGLAYAPAGDRVYATSSDPYALVALDGATGRVLDCETFAPKSAGPVAEAEPWVALAEFAAGGELVVVTRGGAVELRDLPNRAVRETRLPSGLWVASGMTPDGGLLAVLTRSDAVTPSRRLHFLDLAGLRWTSTPEFPSAAGGFTATPDGRFLSVAQSGLRGAILTAVYDLATGERRHLVPGVAPDGQTLDPESGRYVPEGGYRREGLLTSDGRYELHYFEKTFYVNDVLSGAYVVSADNDAGRYDKTSAVQSRVHLAAAPLGGATAIYDTRTWTLLRRIGDSGSVSLAPDGRYLAVLNSGRVTVWELADLPRPKPPTGFPAVRRKAAWDALHAYPTDGDKVPKALWFLQHDPRTVPTLAKRLAPVPLTPPATVAQWLADLGAADPAARAAAYGHLLAQGYAARARLAPSAAGQGEAATLAASLLEATEKLTDAEKDAARAVELLERIASPAAKDLLTRYAAGDPAAKLTVEAQAALGRLK